MTHNATPEVTQTARDRSFHGLSVERSEHGLQRILIKNQSAEATLYLQGAHLTSFKPRGRADLLWVSGAELYRPGQAIRGGIPVCWPWFGPHPQDAGLPSHGLVRTRTWNWETLRDDATVSQLRLWLETDGLDEGFRHRALAELFVTIADTLTVTLTTTNLGTNPLNLSQALHSYLPITAPEGVRLTGLTGYPYLDKLSGNRERWPETFVLDREIDRIVLDDGQPVMLEEPSKPLRFVKRAGSRSLVVWNPWITKSRTLSSFNKEDYRAMLCLEAANAAEDSRQLRPGEQHSLTTELGFVSAPDA